MKFPKSQFNWPYPDLSKPNILYELRTSVIISIVGALSKFFYDFCVQHQTHYSEHFLKAYRSEEKRPLISVSNHHSCFDEPVLWGFLKWSEICSSKRIRWSIAARDICFTNPLYTWFFASGKTIPVVRGDGVNQKGMDFALERLRQNEWLHLFPEGKVNMTKEYLRLKWGVGRLVYESPITPSVLPFYHVGMDDVMPNRRPYLPRPFKKVTIVFGQPMDFSRLVSTLRSSNVPESDARKAITDLVQNELNRLRVEAEELHKLRSLS